LSLFERRRFPVAIILLCVRWYCKYGISYRDLAEMMSERGVRVDPSTIFRWAQRYAPEIENRVRPYQGHRSGSWRVDETYVRVGGRWRYLFRAVPQVQPFDAQHLLSTASQVPEGGRSHAANADHDGVKRFHSGMPHER
jgi:transposase-like protein